MAVIIGIGVVMVITMLFMFWWKLTENGGSWRDPSNPLIPEAQTMVLCTMVLFELFTTFACRSDIHSVFKLGFFSNKWLVLANASSLALLMVVLYVPFFQGPFRVVPMEAKDWMFIAPISLSGFVTVEIIKWIFRRSNKKKRAAQSAA